VDDPALPPGTIRVRITSGMDTGQPTTTVTVFAAPGTPRVASAGTVIGALPIPRLGLSVRWEVRLTTGGIRVLRNGIDVGGGNVVPQWTQATALVGLARPSGGQLRAGIALIAFAGAPSEAPAPVLAPEIHAQPAVEPSTVAPTAAHPGRPIAGVTGGELRLTLVGTTNAPTGTLTPDGVTPTFQVEVNGQRFPATPSVPGLVLQRQVRYPLVAWLPANVLVPNESDGRLPVRVLITAPTGYAGQFSVVHADLEPTAAPGSTPATSTAPRATPAIGAAAHLAVLSAELLDAGGLPLAIGQPVPRGRLVLAVSMDGPAGQRLTGQLGGLAGFQVWLDGTELTAVPTAVDGPGVAGTWQIAFATSGVPAGLHTIEIRALSTQRSVPYTEAYVNFALGQ
jgi:hypothetical protein